MDYVGCNSENQLLDGIMTDPESRQPVSDQIYLLELVVAKKVVIDEVVSGRTSCRYGADD
ncbi:hypothetical protein Mth01_57500 [Sphaerimonospora thailandensis]|uniref:Uncharacterized protein n=1 Tax=Sphaerimonospora thailandensis TaxID=795644 RepID=A0A8J3RGK9_9ACTN|nr:hypothetical protein Mth01_57500 [Sphaerimonospora thailandensis]